LPFLASCSRIAPLRADQEAILSRICELSSRITQREARAVLLKIKTERPETFAASALFARCHALLSAYTFSLPVRRFLHALFDRVSFSDRAWVSAALGE
jgi:rapamycin-insensitive companion of mTOR